MINATRKQKLSRRMHRAMIALNTETPQPVLYRLPQLWYYLAVGCFLLLIATLSTRAALLYRTDVRQLNSHIVQLSTLHAERKEVRRAALISYQNSRVASMRTALPAPKKKVVVDERVSPVAANKRIKAKATPAAIELRVRRSVRSEPATVEEAIQRLVQGRDDRALAWLSNAQAGRSRSSNHWSALRSRAIITGLAEHQYQLGVLYNTLADDSKSLQ